MLKKFFSSKKDNPKPKESAPLEEESAVKPKKIVIKSKRPNPNSAPAVESNEIEENRLETPKVESNVHRKTENITPQVEMHRAEPIIEDEAEPESEPQVDPQEETIEETENPADLIEEEIEPDNPQEEVPQVVAQKIEPQTTVSNKETEEKVYALEASLEQVNKQLFDANVQVSKLKKYNEELIQKVERLSKEQELLKDEEKKEDNSTQPLPKPAYPDLSLDVKRLEADLQSKTDEFQRLSKELTTTKATVLKQKINIEKHLAEQKTVNKFKTEFNALKADFENLKSGKEKVDTELSAVQTTKDKLKTELAATDKKNRMLEIELRRMRDSEAQTKNLQESKIALLEKQLETTNEQLNNIDDSRDKYQNDTAIYNKRAKEYKDFIKNLEKEKSELLAAFQELKSEKEASELTLEERKQKIEDLSEEKTEIKKNLTKLSNDFDIEVEAHKKLKEAFSAIKYERDEFEEKFEILTADKKELQNQFDAKKEDFAKIDTLEASHQDQIKKIQEEKTIVDQRNDRLKTQIIELEKTIKTGETTIQEHLKKIEEEKSKQKGLEQEIEDLRESMASSSDLMQKVEDRDEEISELKKDIIQLKEEKRSLERQKDNIEDEFNGRISVLQNEMAGLLDSIERTEKQKTEQRSQDSNLSSQLQALQEENRSLKDELAEQSKKVLALEYDLLSGGGSSSVEEETPPAEDVTYTILLEIMPEREEFEVDLPGSLTATEILNELRSAGVLDNRDFELLITRTNEIILGSKTLTDCEINQNEHIQIEPA